MAETDLNVKLSLIDNVSNELKEINNNISSQTSSMKTNFGALSTAMKEVGVSMLAMGTAIVTQLTLITKSYVDAGTKLTELSETLGISTDSLSQWGYVAEQNGTTLDALSSHIVYLSRSITDVSGGSGVAQKAIADLGLSLSALQGMNTEEQFRTVTEAIANQSNATERLALTTSIFGRGAMDLLPIISQGTAGINAEMQQAQALGIVMGGQSATAAQSFSRAVTDLKDSFKGLADTIGPIITKTLQPLIENVTKIIDGINTWAKLHPGLTKALVDTALILGPLLIAFGTFFTIASTLIVTLPILSAAVMALGVSVGFLAGMVGLLVIGFAMIAVGVAGLISNMDAKKAATQAAAQADYDAAHASDDLSQSISEQTGILNQQKAAEDAATQATIDHNNAMISLAAQITKLASAYYASQTEAGKLGITLDDVTNYLLKQGYSAQQVFDIENKYGSDVTAIINGLSLSWQDLESSTTAGMEKMATVAAKTLSDTVNALNAYNQAIYAQWQVMTGNMTGANPGGLGGIVPDMYNDPNWMAALSASGGSLNFNDWLAGTGQSLSDWQSTHAWSENTGTNSPFTNQGSDMALNATTNVIVNLDGQPIMNYVNQNLGKAIVQRQNIGG